MKNLLVLKFCLHCILPNVSVLYSAPDKILCNWTYPRPLNSYIPTFLKWTLLFLHLDLSTDANKGFSKKTKKQKKTKTKKKQQQKKKKKNNSRMANNVDRDETARYEPSHLDLHCLHRNRFWYAGLKALIAFCLMCSFVWRFRWKGMKLSLSSLS